MFLQMTTRGAEWSTREVSYPATAIAVFGSIHIRREKPVREGEFVERLFVGQPHMVCNNHAAGWLRYPASGEELVCQEDSPLFVWAGGFSLPTGGCVFALASTLVRSGAPCSWLPHLPEHRVKIRACRVGGAHIGARLRWSPSLPRTRTQPTAGLSEQHPGHGLGPFPPGNPYRLPSRDSQRGSR